jgi:hypothetical protein
MMLTRHRNGQQQANDDLEKAKRWREQAMEMAERAARTVAELQAHLRANSFDRLLDDELK